MYIYLEEVQALRNFEFWPHEPMDIENLPGGQIEHAASEPADTLNPEYPAAQISHEFDPSALYLPAEQGVHEVDPVVLENVPAAHLEQL